MNSDGDKLNTKIVHLDKTQLCSANIFHLESSSCSNNRHIDYLRTMMITNGKMLELKNYKCCRDLQFW
jgi:hypothetical protein